MNLAPFVYGSLPETVADADPVALAARLGEERLSGLVLERLVAAQAAPELQDALRPHALKAAARDLAQAAVLAELCAASRDLKLLVIKGAATGPLLYGSGALRPRWDVDVWVDGWEAATELGARLTKLGWRPVHQLPGTVSRHSIAMARGAGEDIDVHARSCKRVRVADALPFAEAWQYRIVGDPMATLSYPCAWLLAALHLTAHHGGQRPPSILLEDLRRLSIRLTTDDWAWVWARASEHGLLSAVTAATTMLERWARGSMEPGFARALQAVVADESERFGTDFRSVLDDLDLLSGEDSVKYLAELLLPPASYLRAHYGVALDRPTTLLRGYRLLHGALSRLLKSG